MGDRQELSLYLHIPFCLRKCKYCDFLSAPADEETRQRYTKCLTAQIREQTEMAGAYRVISVFFGGGTPTVLPADDLCGLLRAVKETFTPAEGGWDGVEITTECNPATYTETEFEKLINAGFNRLSIGLQSASDQDLSCLGRIHSFGDFLKCYEDARKAGFRNINVDLMSALPGQSPESFENTLHTVCRLSPEHVSVYSLIIEEGTPFYELYGKEDAYRQKTGESLGLLPDEDTERSMVRRTGEILAEYGYEQYEFSNYAKPGFSCRHNRVYWRGGDYLGLGLGAASLLGQRRFRQTSDLQRYVSRGSKDKKAPETGSFEKDREGSICPALQEAEEVLDLTLKDRMEEFMFLGLRMTQGVSEREFQKRFGRRLEEVYGKVLFKYRDLKLMEKKKEYWYLTKQGRDVSNPILADFLLDP